MMRISSFDILNQRSAIDGVRNRTLAGGVITIIASGVAAVLFLAELYMYVKVDVVHHLTVAVPKGRSLYNKNQGQMSEKARARLKNKGKVKVAVKLTFPHLDCTLLELVYDGNGGWGYTSDEIENIHELKSRLVKSPTNSKDAVEAGMGTFGGQGCTIQGSLYVEKVAGSFGVQLSSITWRSVSDLLLIDNLSSMVGEDLGPNNRKRKHLVDIKHNSSHFIHYMDFGNNFPHTPNPLQKTRSVYDDNDIPLGLSVYYVKLVPTRYKKPLSAARDTIQVSMAEHNVRGAVIAMTRSRQTPGISVSYDFSPLEVHHTEQREGLLSFIASLTSIVGGVFVTVSLISRFLVGAVNAAKKFD